MKSDLCRPFKIPLLPISLATWLPPNHTRFPTVLVYCKHGSLLPPGPCTVYFLCPEHLADPTPAQTHWGPAPKASDSYTHKGYFFLWGHVSGSNSHEGILFETLLFGVKNARKKTGATDGSNASKKGWFLARKWKLRIDFGVECHLW